MSKTRHRIKAVFYDYSAFLKALKVLADKKYSEMEVFSPMPLHDIQRLLPQKPSRVRWFTFLGGILGMGIGFGFPIYTVLQWPLITGGKPIVTIQAFIIIAFELLILFGAIFTLLGLLFYAKLPRQNLTNYDVRFSENSFGVIILAETHEAEDIKNLLKEADDLDDTKIDVVDEHP